MKRVTVRESFSEPGGDWHTVLMVQAGSEYQAVKITSEQQAEIRLVGFAGIPRYGIAYDGT